MTNDERLHLAALCKSRSEDTDGEAGRLLARAAAALSVPQDAGIVTRDDVDSALGCLDAIATSLEQLYAHLAPILIAVASEAAKAKGSQ
jgi:hypothetical protein